MKLKKQFLIVTIALLCSTLGHAMSPGEQSKKLKRFKVLIVEDAVGKDEGQRETWLDEFDSLFTALKSAGVLSPNDILYGEEQISEFRAEKGTATAKHDSLQKRCKVWEKQEERDVEEYIKLETAKNDLEKRYVDLMGKFEKKVEKYTTAQDERIAVTDALVKKLKDSRETAKGYLKDARRAADDDARVFLHKSYDILTMLKTIYQLIPEDWRTEEPPARAQQWRELKDIINSAIGSKNYLETFKDVRIKLEEKGVANLPPDIAAIP